MDISWLPALFWRYLEITGKSGKLVPYRRPQYFELSRLNRLALLSPQSQTHTYDPPPRRSRVHGDRLWMLMMCMRRMRCYTRADDGQTVQQKGVCASKGKRQALHQKPISPRPWHCRVKRRAESFDMELNFPLRDNRKLQERPRPASLTTAKNVSGLQLSGVHPTTRRLAAADVRSFPVTTYPPTVFTVS
jgi:hypothetical protein